MRRPSFLFRFHWTFVNCAVDKLIEELKAEQGDAEDLVHLTLSSVEEASLDPMKPRMRALQIQVPMLQLLTWIDETAISGLLMPSLMLEDADVDPRHGEEMCAVAGGPLGDVDDVAASHFLRMCHSFRALLASRWRLTTWTISRTGLMTWWPCRICL